MLALPAWVIPLGADQACSPASNILASSQQGVEWAATLVLIFPHLSAA